MISAALESVMQWDVLLVIALAAMYGILVGAIPGLTATMAVALVVPLTFYLDSVQAIAVIVTTVTCSIFAGDIPTTLVRIPGTPASAAYADDAYAMTRQGKHARALGICLWFSVVGGLFGTIVLAAAAPLLSELAASFTSFEYFWLYVLGLSCAAIVSSESRFKGLFSLSLGLLLSAVGLGTDFSTPRLTFGFDQLITGISFIPAMIGLFGVSEVLRLARAILSESRLPNQVDGGKASRQLDSVPPSATNIDTSVVRMLLSRKFHLLRSSSIGAVVGMLPGAGADIASWISYAISKRFSSEPQQYGKGSEAGLSDATGANNAALGSAWIPALVFGIPGDSVTAIAIGVLLMKNITPGPEIFDFQQNPEQATLVASIYVAFVIANLMLIPMGLLAISGASLLIRIPRRILLPVILLFCVLGSYSMSGSYFDVWLMLAMGLLGYVLEGFRIPLGPIVLGLIMGGPLEHRFLQSLTVAESWTGFLSSAVSILLAAVCLGLWIVPLLTRRKGNWSSET